MHWGHWCYSGRKSWVVASSESFSEAISELGNERDSGNEEELIDSRGVF